VTAFPTRLILVLFAWLSFAASAIPAITRGYDLQTHHVDTGYDVGLLSTIDYDSAAVQFATSEANPTVGAGGIFGKTTEFLAAEEEGIIYLRTSANGAEYVGQAKNAARYAERQLEHAADHPTESFTFQELERVPANSGRSLDVAEEDWIRAGGGPKKYGGGLENDRWQMNDKDYHRAGGTIPLP
jgi:hypothetical protein